MISAVFFNKFNIGRPVQSPPLMARRVETSTVDDGLELIRTQSAFARRAVRLERMATRRVCPVGFVASGVEVTGNSSDEFPTVGAGLLQFRDGCGNRGCRPTGHSAPEGNETLGVLISRMEGPEAHVRGFLRGQKGRNPGLAEVAAI